ncbi:inositol hexakisphosphate-domain-containing protein [Naematelia encephala]|uniref:Inositol hexakisphosphate-domain-containing protein n=1 Tax=Naematelia encephala TaxID=71784 RepID=A0A1Y2BJH5_9TREE|nr:inositol hexakisphosphate-domain-containing protein [Naematelia encephala]
MPSSPNPNPTNPNSTSTIPDRRNSAPGTSTPSCGPNEPITVFRTPPNTSSAYLPPRSSPLTGTANRHGSFDNGPQTKTQTQTTKGDNSSSSSSGTKKRNRVLGIQERLRREADGVVKRRTGGVLARGFLLKTDHYPDGRALDLDLTIQGAPNFRAPDEEGLNVYGVAQPTLPGLKSILTILRCQPHIPSHTPVRRDSQFVGSPNPNGTPLEHTTSQPAHHRSDDETTPEVEEGRAIWFSTREETLIYCNGRPYVLRDAANPFQILGLSSRSTNLEDIERRLKLDILDEARRYGGMILIHDEVSSGEIQPTWMSVDEGSIRTPREVWEDVKSEGWRVGYYRIPIAPDTPIEDNYLDTYVSVLRGVDPLNTSLVFNCGMGVVRTTFGMVAALLVRRKQFLLRGLDDPFPTATGASGFVTPATGPQAAYFLEQATIQQSLNKSLLKLTRVLDRNLPSRHPATAIDLLASQPTLLEQLRKAHMGNYQIVLSLLSSLDQGRQMKRLVDHVIDISDVVVNLRENVIEHRIKYSVSAMDEKGRRILLAKALRSLEQYFDLIVFAAYLEEEDAGDSGVTFSGWLKGRPEIWNQIKLIRRQGGNRLSAFAPVNDLSLISRTSDFVEGPTARQRQSKGELDLQGGKVLGDEWADHVVKNRSGIMLRASTLLKSDLWLTESAPSVEGVRGAVGFRQIRSGSPIYATGQPTQDAISTILRVIQQRTPSAKQIIWVCLREEPLVMINGSPYCLRRDGTALRNMRDYSGVSASRLEVLEERLKSDVIAELSEFNGRVLLHSETVNGEVIPVWESVDKRDVASIREVMDSVKSSSEDIKLSFVRIPVTSESSPDFHDITELLDLCMHTDLEQSAFILNDQLGRGRSSTTAVIVLLIQRWLKRGEPSRAPPTPSRARPGLQRSTTSTTSTPKTSWQIINSCLRVIRNGLDVKQVVDEAIDAAATHFNLRDAIEDFREKAESAKTPEEKQSALEKGIYHLRRYYHLLIFQAYLDDTSPEEQNPYSFESFVKHRPVFKTLESELVHGGLTGLTPLDRVDPAQGMALPDEVSKTVASRRGVILSAQTILKSDFFSGLQKQTLPELVIMQAPSQPADVYRRVDGAANYRKVPLDCLQKSDTDSPNGSQYVYGTGMPSADGLRNALQKMEAGPDGPRRVMWTSLREEPVLYVNGRPHVLRLADKPLTNVETTGVKSSVVERMEVMLKDDVLKEIRAGDSRLLLHDEVETKPGTFEIIPIWETVKEGDVMTPRELYEGVIREKYQVDYMRVAITDEQAPLPAALQVIVGRVVDGLKANEDFVFNCQMGRGRTTTGMITASLIVTIATEDMALESEMEMEEEESQHTGIEAESAQYLNGEYKTILQLVTVLSHGKQAKRLTDRATNQMEGVQNLRKAVYDFKLRVDAADPGSSKYTAILRQATNYLYRYGTLIVLANFLLEAKEEGVPFGQADFPAWMQRHSEIRAILRRSTLN